MSTLASARFEELAAAGRSGTEFTVLTRGNDLRGILWHGVSASVLAPESYDAIERLSRHALAISTRYSSIVAERGIAMHMWNVMREGMPREREVRSHQPLLEYSAGQASDPAPATVEAAETRDLSHVFPAAVAMFREEVGTDPCRGDGGRGYRARVEHLLRERRTYIARDGERIVFKADLGALFGDVAQVHGVWIDPAYRGKGLAAPFMRETANLIRRDHAPRVTLYVNSFNTRARRAYERAGFVPVGELATVLF
ncbi:GNAT family N-acetyltransferase [Dermabacter sp. p3-SID358]|uniref:GNAT family N-acetyltransferase n=1 Tax=Dermabacter sp. p3-SID358 TaxID=2916114 RepID=UPI0021A53952|nr:GNAT family N-acetyltransferase [Dermabacter sp. p3-SID358]MCT1866206.1 GNAT family N-acetyltransferase [Dermabacter sp. p3-SID358]